MLLIMIIFTYFTMVNGDGYHVAHVSNVSHVSNESIFDMFNMLPNVDCVDPVPTCNRWPNMSFEMKRM